MLARFSPNNPTESPTTHHQKDTIMNNSPVHNYLDDLEDRLDSFDERIAALDERFKAFDDRMKLKLDRESFEALQAAEEDDDDICFDLPNDDGDDSYDDAGADYAQDEFERRHDRKQPITWGSDDREVFDGTNAVVVDPETSKRLYERAVNDHVMRDLNERVEGLKKVLEREKVSSEYWYKRWESLDRETRNPPLTDDYDTRDHML